MRVSVMVIITFVATACGVVEEASLDPIEETEEVADVEQPTPFGPPVALENSEHRLAFETTKEWAPIEEFESRWGAGVEPWRILHCDESTTTAQGNQSETGPTLMIQLGAAGPWVGAVVTAAGELQWLLYRAKWSVAEQSGTTVSLEAVDEVATFECRQARFEDPGLVEGPYASWVYSATLLNPPEPVYVDTGAELTDQDRRRLAQLRKGPWSREMVERLIDVSPSNRDPAWGDALTWAKAEGADDLTYELYRRYRPVGRCSRDPRPQQTKQDFADFCAKTERTRCELVLLTQLLAYKIPRVSDMWIGGKPVSYESDLDRLPDGLDVPRFMLGLLLDFPGTDGNEAASISPQFFGLATYGTAYTAALSSRLETWLANPKLDSWNRHRIALALFVVRARMRSTEPAAKHASAVAKLPGVPAITKVKLAGVE